MSKVEALKEILEVLEKNSQYIERTFVDERASLKAAINIMSELEKFDITLSDIPTYDHISFSQFQHLTRYGQQIGRLISWSDDDRQPEEAEWLYVISFSSGAYIFGSHYPTALFNEFFAKLKEFGPKYTDTPNHTLYFSHDMAKKVHEIFQTLFKHYSARAKSERDSRIDELEMELKKLKQGINIY